MSCNFKKLYTSDYVQAQLEKFQNRQNNHWKYHISLAKNLVSNYAPDAPARMLDLGCSIGTFALEFAIDGYEAIGLDFDPKALAQAENLARELGCKPIWECQDATSFNLNDKVSFVVCFDLLEHLSDKMIREMLACVRNNLIDNGVFIFHTFPTEFDHVFYKFPLTCIPLIPFKNISADKFEKIVRVYSVVIDCYYLLLYGKTHQQYIQTTIHPNPLSAHRVEEFFVKGGFDILLLETGLDEVNPLKPGQGKLAKKYFFEQPIAQRSIWGVVQKI